MNFQSQVLRCIFVSERVITVSKSKDQKSFNQSRRTKKSFNRIRKELKGKIQESTENQQDLRKTKPKESRSDRKTTKTNYKKLSHVQLCLGGFFVL
jgi:hypothetical protein